MKAIVYDAPRKFTYRDVEVPAIAPDEILLRVDACGLCGTDLHVHEGEFGARFPLIPGHEFSGEIVEVGSAVKGLSKGQRATASTTQACGYCFYCKRGDFLLCENLGGIGVEINGAFAEYIKVKGALAFPVNQLSVREAAMIEPTACAVHGMEVLAVKPGSSVLLLGAGPTGQVLAQLLKINGASRLTVAAAAPPVPVRAPVGSSRSETANSAALAPAGPLRVIELRVGAVFGAAAAFNPLAEESVAPDCTSMLDPATSMISDAESEAPLPTVTSSARTLMLLPSALRSPPIRIWPALTS